MKILIDTDWFSAIQDLQPSKQKEVLMAILNYPNGDSDTNLWKKTILPNLEKGKISYFNKLQNLKQNNPQKFSKKNPDSASESVIGSETEPNTDTTIREDKDKIKNKVDIYTRFNAGFQNWKFEPALLTVSKRHWTLETIRKIEIDFSCQEYNTETSIQELLERYPADVSKGFKKPTLDEVKAYCRERNNSVDPEKFYNYYESNGWKVGKNPMKNWKSAVITWEKSGYNTQKKPNINLDACEDNFLDDTPYWLKNKKD